MASMTAVELGADICALARTSVRRGDVQLLAAETLDPAAFPSIGAFTGAIRQARTTLKLPKRCCAVVWGLPDGAGRKDPTVTPLIAPLTGAGFRVERVISPCNALAALARLRTPRGDGATCWLAINRTGVAMVVVRPGQQLYAHSFGWDSNVGASGSQARLLQRYSLVAFLAPEIGRAMNAAREKGTPIEAVVTCGNLPEIRSLTMPLIEELDVEVEALDSLDGLIVKPGATDRLADLAASLRIACAGAIARPTRRFDESRRPSSALRSVGRVAAAAAVVAAVGVIGWRWWNREAPAPAVTRTATTTKSTSKAPPPVATKQPIPKPVTQAPPQTKQETPARAKPSTPAPPPVAKQTTPAPPPTGKRPPPPTETQGPQTPTQAPPAVKQTPAPPKPAPSPTAGTASAISEAATRAAANTPSPVKLPVAPPATAEVRKPAEAKPSQPPLDTPSRAADKPDATRVRPSGPPPEPLKDPVPRVTAILVSSDRRMATIEEGRIISVGDALGRRVVVGIDERAVTLREPSGVQIRVGLGGRILGVARGER